MTLLLFPIDPKKHDQLHLLTDVILTTYPKSSSKHIQSDPEHTRDIIFCVFCYTCYLYLVDSIESLLIIENIIFISKEWGILVAELQCVVIQQQPFHFNSILSSIILMGFFTQTESVDKLVVQTSLMIM